MLGDGDDGGVELLLDFDVWTTPMSLHSKKSQSRHNSNPLVPIEICLGFGQVEGICGRHFEIISSAVEVGIFGRCESGFD